MTTLEIVLAIALTLTCILLARLYRKHLILRHVFSHSSDWCACKIDEMVESACSSIGYIVTEDAARIGQEVTDKQARDNVPFVILNAATEWTTQKEAFQTRLIRNGIRPLDGHDLDDLIWSPWIAGIRA